MTFKRSDMRKRVQEIPIQVEEKKRREEKQRLD